MTHFISTPATITTCPRCKLPALTAHDEGLRAVVDFIPLPNRAAEITALLNGRMTYTRLRNGHLVYRSPERITAGTITGPIHAEHKCVGPQQLLIDDLFGTEQK